MKNSIEKIDLWLKENANGIFDALNEPASSDQLEKLKNSFEARIPEDLDNWFRLHNGLKDGEFANLVYGLSFYSIEKVIKRHESIASSMYDQEMRFNDKGVKKTFNGSAQKIAIADDNSSCDLYIDLDPDSEGSFGQVVFFDSTYQVAILVANSLSELFEKFLTDLESGGYELLPEALEDGVHWLQGKGELDIINWPHSSKWSSILE